MILHGYYRANPRTRRQAEALVDSGHQVDVLAMRDPMQPKTATLNGVRVITLPLRRHRNSGRFVYTTEYMVFLMLAAAKLTVLYARRRYDVIQAHTPPDILVLAAAVPKFFGARVLLDLHELMPEFYMSKYDVTRETLMVRALKHLERVSIAFADRSITASHLFRQRLIERGNPGWLIEVIPNSADSKVFNGARMRRIRTGKSLVLLNHGTVAERYGLDVAIKAVEILRAEIPDIRLLIYDNGNAPSPCARRLREMAVERGLERHVLFRGPVDITKIPSVIKAADIGVVPMRRDQHTNIAFPSRIFEYVALETPVIVGKTDVVSSIFGDDAVRFFEPDDFRDLAARVLELYEHPERAARLVANAKRVYKEYRWERSRQRYLECIETI